MKFVSLSAVEVEKHLEREKFISAIKIQALWRGHTTRKGLASTQKVVHETRAAICMQRGVSEPLVLGMALKGQTTIFIS